MVVAQVRVEMIAEALHQEESIQKTVTVKDLKVNLLEEIEMIILLVLKETLTEETQALHLKKMKEETLKERNTHQEVVVIKVEMKDLPVILVIEEKSGNNSR
jgi:hypothetical protein